MCRGNRQFHFRLALALGYPHPDFLLGQITSRQLKEWQEFDRIEPIGDQRMDFHFSQLEMIMMNIAIKLYGKEGTPPAELTDFYPTWGRPDEKQHEPKRQSPEDISKAFLSIAREHNRGVKRHTVKVPKGEQQRRNRYK